MYYFDLTADDDDRHFSPSVREFQHLLKQIAVLLDVQVLHLTLICIVLTGLCGAGSAVFSENADFLRHSGLLSDAVYRVPTPCEFPRSTEYKAAQVNFLHPCRTDRRGPAFTQLAGKVMPLSRVSNRLGILGIGASIGCETAGDAHGRLGGYPESSQV